MVVPEGVYAPGARVLLGLSQVLGEAVEVRGSGGR